MILNLIGSDELIFTGDFFECENFIRLFKLLPLPDIKTAVPNLFEPVNFFI